MKTIPTASSVLVLRTDFSDNETWEIICKAIQTPNVDFGFLPYVEFCNDREFDGISEEKVLEVLSKEYVHSIIFIVDNFTVTHPEYPVLCTDLEDQPGRSFRVIPSEMWAVENNLSIVNMDFEEFVDNVDDDGIYRGVKY